MADYDSLMRQSPIPVYDEAELPEGCKGLYVETNAAEVILIDKHLPTTVEKTCILAEELGHYHTSSGNIVDQDKLTNRKQERTARGWAYRKLVPLQSIVDAHRAAIRNRHELADRLQVTEEFLGHALEWYRDKYGPYVNVGGHTICFEPLGVLEMFE